MPLRTHGQIAYMSILPRERLGIVVLVNSRSAPMVHMALANRILDAYLGYSPRDWAGEARARVPDAERAREADMRSMIAMRSPTPHRLPLAAFAGLCDVVFDADQS